MTEVMASKHSSLPLQDHILERFNSNYNNILQYFVLAQINAA